MITGKRRTGGYSRRERLNKFFRAGNSKDKEFMTDAVWNRLIQRAQSTTPDGQLMSFITGKETIAELRLLCLQLTQQCPCECANPQCPFRLMAKVSRPSLTDWLSSLPRKDLEEIFEMELLCRKLAKKEK
jgi:hypothetical protein